jgi:hypothetical protein
MRWIFHVRRDKAKEFEEKVKDELAHLTSEEWDAWLGPTTDAMPSRKQREKAQDGRPELIVNNHSVPRTSSARRSGRACCPGSSAGRVRWFTLPGSMRAGMCHRRKGTTGRLRFSS